jgi:hypothetical protein
MANSPSNTITEGWSKRLFVGVWQVARRVLRKPRPRRERPLDLMEARDDMLRDIGLFDGPDVVLRRSDLLPPSERERLFERGPPF